ncbi:MAG: hypothetical protein AMJ53_10105 [Gammaproteobacteria bacterium SG8_11]|nr:MAG: hypothetical protein AMJ53_10105 [Gammaproteobacteria bacterium SG8_11]
MANISEQLDLLELSITALPSRMKHIAVVASALKLRAERGGQQSQKRCIDHKSLCTHKRQKDCHGAKHAQWLNLSIRWRS